MILHYFNESHSMNLYILLLFIIFYTLILLEPLDETIGWRLWNKAIQKQTIENNEDRWLQLSEKLLKISEEKENEELNQLDLENGDNIENDDRINTSNILEHYKNQIQLLKTEHFPLLNNPCFFAPSYRSFYLNNLINHLRKNNEILNEDGILDYISDLKIQDKWVNPNNECSLQILSKIHNINPVISFIESFKLLIPFLLVFIFFSITKIENKIQTLIKLRTISYLYKTSIILLLIIFIILYSIYKIDIIIIILFPLSVELIYTHWKSNWINSILLLTIGSIILIQVDSFVLGSLFCLAFHESYLIIFKKYFLNSEFNGWKRLIGDFILLFTILFDIYIVMDSFQIDKKDYLLFPDTANGWNIATLFYVILLCQFYFQIKYDNKFNSFIIIFKSIIGAILSIIILLIGRSYSLSINIFHFTSMGIIFILIFYIVQFTKKLETICIIFYLVLLSTCFRILVKSYELEIAINLLKT